MEITELNLIGDFEAGMKCLHNPSLISKLSLIPKLYSFWTCGALILAVFATFTSVFNKIKLFVHHIRLRFLLSCQNSCPQQIFDDDDFDFDFSDDDDDDTQSSVAESDDEDLDSDDDGRVDAIFRAEGCSYWGVNEGQDGNFTSRRRSGFSWSDFSSGKSVVQLWDSFGLGLDFEDDESEEYGSQVPVWAPENIVVTAGGFGTYDSGIYAAWRPRQRKVWSVGRKEE